ncbi:MAG: hypothetical protein Ct9H300mP21_01690 [Pseudomonadota bacterium]|nr:MAG: hypothetical protein Ct9H300mP21_01690 [Pseudomonadota bacterium]
MQHIVTVNQVSGAQVKLKFKGLPGPIEEQQLIKTLFRNNPRWKKLSLDTISSNFVSYKALFLGPLKQIIQEFRSPKNAPFRITSVNWEDNDLVVQVEWNEVPMPLELFETTLTDDVFSKIDSEETIFLNRNIKYPYAHSSKHSNCPLQKPFMIIFGIVETVHCSG